MVTKVHACGRRITDDEEAAFHTHLWGIRGRQAGAEAKAFVDSFWPETFSRLCEIASCAETRPDFIIGDYQCEAAKDAAIEHGIPFAVFFPQFPWMIPAPHVPGLCGLHERAICTEGASWSDRLWEMTFPLRRAPELVKIWRRNKAMRWKSGLRRMPQDGVPSYVALVNSFEGFEIARELPPNCAAVGPLLADEYAGLDGLTHEFLEGRRAAYVAFGTHVMIDLATVEKLASGLSRLIADGLLGGVVLSLSPRTRSRLQVRSGSVLEDIVENRNHGWHVVEYAPQRAILSHPSTVLFLTHAGASSVQEGIFHGKPMISLAVWGDQLSNALRIERSGVGRRLSISCFTASDLHRVAGSVLRDEDGSIARNVLRLRRIAHVASRRKQRAADMIEEHLYDWELRHQKVGADPPQWKALQPMHLQPPSARLSWVKLHNLDIWLPIFAFLAIPAIVLLQTIAEASRPTASLVTLVVLSVSVILVAFFDKFNRLTDLARISSQSHGQIVR